MKPIKNVAIIGAGPSGISAYLQLIKELHTELSSITLFDPQGIANSFSFNTDLESSLTNTSVGVTSLYADDRLDYFKWLCDKRPNLNLDPPDFPSRFYFKEYCCDRVNQSRKYAEFWGCSTHINQEKVTDISFTGNKFSITSNKNEIFLFDAVILATGIKTAIPDGLNEKLYNFIATPYPERNFLSRISNQSKVLVLGSKLAAIDISIAIHNCFPDAKVTMVSRSGKLPSVRGSLLIKHLGGNEWRALKKYVNQATDRENCSENSLEKDIDNCKHGLNSWESMLGQFIEEFNEHIPTLPLDLQEKVSQNFKYFIKHYVSSFPLKNAEIPLKSLKNKNLKIIKSELSDHLLVKNNVILPNDSSDACQFDLVINASGITNTPVDNLLNQSLSKLYIRKNHSGGLKVTPSTMRVKSKGNSVPLYVVGGPAAGEIPITNYIRSSVIQSKKVANDLADLMQSSTQESFVNHA